MCAMACISNEEKEKTLICCPVSLLDQWQYEIETKTTFQCIQYYGKTKNEDTLNSEAQIIITSSTTVRNDSLLQNHQWYRIIYDEVHEIRNTKVQAAQALSKFKSRKRWGLTGTPCINGTDDLFGLCMFLNILELPVHYKEISPQICMKMLKRQFAYRVERENLLNTMMVQKTFADCKITLPEKHVEITLLEMNERELEYYLRIENIIREKAAGTINAKGQYVKMLGYIVGLRQAANDLRLCIKDPFPEYKGIKMTKLIEIVKATIERNQGEKIIVFVDFIAMMGLIGQELEKQFPNSDSNKSEEKDQMDNVCPYLYFVGDMKTEERTNCLNDFRNHQGTCVLIASKTCSGVGLNLTTANIVVLMSGWYNYSLDEQCIARAHRIGQQKPVYVYKFICQGTIDSRIDQIATQKQQQIERLFALNLHSPQDQNIKRLSQKKLTDDQFQFLLLNKPLK